MDSEIWDKIHAKGQRPWEQDTPQVKEWLTFLQSANSGKALDLGCGTGTYCGELAAAGFNVTGIDISPKALEIARASYPNVQFIQQDLNNLKNPSTDLYDLILDVKTFFAIRERNYYLQQIKSMLAPSGFFILQFFVHNTEKPFLEVKDDYLNLPFKIHAKRQISSPGKESITYFLQL